MINNDDLLSTVIYDEPGIFNIPAQYGRVLTPERLNKPVPEIDEVAAIFTEAMASVGIITALAGDTENNTTDWCLVKSKRVSKAKQV
jgi:hypothetical protein